MRPVIHSTKHYRQMSLSTVVTVTRNSEVLCEAKEGTTASAVDEVIEGALVKAIYIELWCLNSGNDGSEVITLDKVNGQAVVMSFADTSALGLYKNKKNILWTHQGLSSNDGVSGPYNVIRQWIKIPKSKQRMGLGDRLILTISNPSLNTLTYCGFSTYKEYT